MLPETVSTPAAVPLYVSAEVVPLMTPLMALVVLVEVMASVPRLVAAPRLTLPLPLLMFRLAPAAPP